MIIKLPFNRILKTKDLTYKDFKELALLDNISNDALLNYYTLYYKNRKIPKILTDIELRYVLYQIRNYYIDNTITITYNCKECNKLNENS